MSRTNGDGAGRALERQRDPEEIRGAIDDARAEIARSVLALRAGIARSTDWRLIIVRRPGLALAAAFGLGLLIAWRRGRGAREGREG